MITTHCCIDNLPKTADYIDSPDALNKLGTQMQCSNFVALDTEFVREKTYLPRLCLIQIATSSILAIIDPLALQDLRPFLEILQNPTITKVLHSGRQDLEIFHEQYGVISSPLFDTQLAATLLGHGDQIGYGALVEAECKIRLDKAHTRTDWAARPLDPGQLRYAMDDVRYLAILYPQMRKRLEQDGRLHWLLEDFTALANPAGYGTSPEDAWKRVRGAHTLQGRHLVAIQRLANWREQQARSEDRPRRWIISDEVLLELARQVPRDRHHVDRIVGLETQAAHRYGHELMMLLREIAEKSTPTSKQSTPRRPMLSLEQEAVVDYLLAVVRTQCVTHKVSLASLTSRRELEDIVLGESDLPLLHGWRRALAGQAILDVLHGQAQLIINSGRPKLNIRK